MRKDDEELEFCAARPEFASLSHEEVLRAIEGDRYGDSAVTCELTRLITTFLARFIYHAEKRAGVVPDQLTVEAGCPIEAIALLALIHIIEARGANLPSTALH